MSDTLALARRLEAAGFPPKQAQDVSAAVAEAMSAVATKADLRDLEQSLTIRFGGMMVVAVGLLLAAIR